MAKNRPKFTFLAVFGNFWSIWPDLGGGNRHVRYSYVQPECYLVSPRHMKNINNNCAKLGYPYYEKSLGTLFDYYLTLYGYK